MKIIVHEVTVNCELEAFVIDTSLVDETNADQTAYRDIVMKAMQAEDREGNITLDNCFTNNNEELDNIKIIPTAKQFVENNETVMLFIRG